MAKIKYTIEIDEQVIETLKKQFQSVSEKLSPNFAPKTFENFLEQIVDSYVKTSEQMKDLGSKFGDIFNKIGDIGDLDLEKIFGNFGEKKQEQPKDKKPEESKLKN